MSKLYKELYTRHSEYKPELNEKLCLLYEGGFAIREKASLFLEQLKGIETGPAYQSRLKSIAYIPYLSEFITQFGASLFSEALEVKPQSDAADPTTAGEDTTDDFYKEFMECCDLERRSFHQFAQDVLEKALDELCVYVSLDFPKGERLNRAQEKADGLDRGYACVIPYNNIIDWKIDPATGKFIWVKEFEECFSNDNPIEEPKHYFQFKIRTLKPGKDGKVFGGWDIWQTELMPLSKKCTANTVFNKNAEESAVTSFPEINVWKLQINKAYHVGQQIGSLCQEHYQRRSFMVANSNKTCVSIGVFEMIDDVGAPGDGLPPDIEVPQDSSQFRKKLESEGWVVTRNNGKAADKVYIVEAKGESHKFVSDELKHLVESMMQTLRQMNMTATANQKAVGRSAASKQIDQHGTSMLLSVYERVIKDFSNLLFSCLAAGRGEDIKFTVEGLSISEPNFNRTELVTELTQFGVDIMKFPDIWKNKYLNKAALELIDNNINDTERAVLQEKFTESIEAGEFKALDPDEATAAGNKMAKTTGKQPTMEAGSDETMPLSDMGHPQLPEGSHLQTGEHIDGKTVYDHLADDYKKSDIEFVKHIPWTGPVSVPLTSIDSSNMHNWAATQSDQQDKIDMWSDKFSKGDDIKPIVLFNNKSNDNKMMIGDGHHRFLGALKAGQPVPAYIGETGSDSGPWDRMHSKQIGGGSNEKSNQKSNQKENVQKAEQNQVSKSENAVGGKVK